jgi:hypothetical protein
MRRDARRERIAYPLGKPSRTILCDKVRIDPNFINTFLHEIVREGFPYG